MENVNEIERRTGNEIARKTETEIIVTETEIESAIGIGKETETGIETGIVAEIVIVIMILGGDGNYINHSCRCSRGAD